MAVTCLIFLNITQVIYNQKRRGTFSYSIHKTLWSK